MSESSSQSNPSTTTNNIDRRTVNDHGLSISGDGNAVSASITDAGSIAKAFDFATSANSTAHADMTSAVGLASDAINTNADLLKTNSSALLQGFGGLLDLARSTVQTAQTANATATQAVAGAYSTAQEISNGQKFLVAGGLVIAGIVAVKSMGAKL
ncbi:hypothetical protein OYT13_11425 [Pandoraea sp. XJJ-1]|uniref:hypothetical protein n=1 Tax=Pandoraea sp. XJJ-1 TaxID=3002643 RepID=UPI0022806ADF|nr:hypothetical protein [Pandoraea sp. XJJ-1]WAL84957.1 hypothetical protein OYT13_11425 [Pandoraea sp. XJJ-1]